MVYSIARLLQLAGLIILPVAVSANITQSMNLKQSLMLSGIGMGLFFVGWLLQQTSKPK